MTSTKAMRGVSSRTDAPRKCLELAAFDNPEIKPPRIDFQTRCCALNRSTSLAAAAEQIHALGPRALLALFAELLAGRAPEAAIREYAAISHAAIVDATRALSERRAPQ
jgi:hypothetical protein